ncbi:MAG: hypothetical protein HY435_03350 [Candidatus Liptonbacteria bacterium]|nr:hypothetical protein [Candidatus Liptonbacteria bacterium]
MTDERSIFGRALAWVLYGRLAEDKRNLPKYGTKTLIFRLLGIFTVGYVMIQLYVFHKQLDAIPREMVSAWMIWLFGYIVLKESFRWSSVGSTDAHFGEIFVLLITGAFCWMEGWNLYHHWFRAKPYFAIPGGYFESMVEAFVLLVLTGISSAFYHRRSK